MDDRNYRFTSSLVAALAGSGVAHAAIAPGSRSTPLAMTMAAEPRLRDWPIHDERSAGFFVLGIGKATGTPGVVVCTSGTAAAELHPAVVEARYGRVPMLVITADRPTDVWETGAPQTIDQRGIYGTAPLWSHDLDVPGPGDAAPGFPAALAARMVAEAVTGPGPVHLNLRFREPLVPASGIPEPAGPVPSVSVGHRLPGRDDLAAAASLVRGRRGLVVAGPHPGGDPHPLVTAAETLGVPVLADPQSPARLAGSGAVIGSGAALAAAGILDRLTPEVVIRIGAPPTSKAVWAWLAAHPEVPQVVIDDAGWPDPGASAWCVVRAHPEPAVALLGRAVEEPAPAGWLEAWQEADRRAAAAIREALEALPFPTEPGIAAVVAGAVPEGSLLYVASSMPIRDLDLTLGAGPRRIRVAANRGANGIDGLLSSALGAAAAGAGPVAALTGDLAFLHDLAALVPAARFGLPLTMVVVDNDGGGIFHFLPQAGFPDVFERHFGAPHGLDLPAAAEGLGVPARVIGDAGELAAALAEPGPGPQVLVLRTDRHGNLEVHRRIADAVAAALDG